MAAGTIKPLQASIDEFKRKTKNLVEDQIPFAVSVALNETAKKTNAKLKREMGLYIDKPTPWTKNSTRVNKWSTKKDLRASVGFKDSLTDKGTPAADYLQAPVFGGSRASKKFAGWLKSRGFMPAGLFIVPGRNAPKDRFGNVPASFYRKVATDLSKGPKFTKTGKLRKTKGPKFFPLTKNGKPWAIAEAVPTGGQRLVFLFVPRVNYRRSFDFYRITRQDSTAIFPAELRKAYRKAIKTARF